MGVLLDNAFETPAVILTDGNQVTGGLISSTTDDAWIAEPDAPIGSVHYKTDGTRQTRIAFTGSGVADDFASENPLATGGGGAVSFSWRFSTSTTEGDPGNARIRFDNATPASVTALFVDDFDTAGIDVSGILNALPIGTRIYLQQQDASGNFLIGTTTAITDNTGWFKIELTVTDSGTLPANNKVVGVLFFASGGGITGVVVEDEGSTVAGGPHPIMNFAGAGVTAADAGGGRATITIPGGSGITVEDEGSPLATLADTLDFVGAGVTASGAGGTKTITIPGATAADQAAVQARRTTALAFTLAWADVTLDDTHFENDPAVVEHDAITDRIALKDPGPYWIEYRVDTDQPAPITQWQTLVQARVTVNDGGAALPLSDSNEQALEDGSLVGDGAVWPSLKAGFIYDATANDFITLQIQRIDSDTGTNIQAAAGRVTFSAVRMTGEKGADGAPGPGGSSTFLKHETVLTSGDITITAAAFTDVAGAISPAFTPAAGEIVFLYTLVNMEAPGGADKMHYDILHNNSGSFVSIFATTRGVVTIERDDHSNTIGLPITLPNAVSTQFKIQAKVDTPSGVISADTATNPLVIGVMQGGGGSVVRRIGHTYAISGEIKVPSGQIDFIIPFFVSLAGGQTAKLVKARHQINGGTSVTADLELNGTPAAGFSGISITTTPTDQDPADVVLADNDELALVVTAVAGTPENMTFTIFLEMGVT